MLESDISKTKKVKFFKEEIQSYLGLKRLDFQYENKLKSAIFELINEDYSENINEIRKYYTDFDLKIQKLYLFKCTL